MMSGEGRTATSKSRSINTSAWPLMVFAAKLLHEAIYDTVEKVTKPDIERKPFSAVFDNNRICKDGGWEVFTLRSEICADGFTFIIPK